MFEEINDRAVTLKCKHPNKSVCNQLMPGVYDYWCPDCGSLISEGGTASIPTMISQLQAPLGDTSQMIRDLVQELHPDVIIAVLENLADSIYLLLNGQQDKYVFSLKRKGEELYRYNARLVEEAIRDVRERGV